jgi:L-rhamnose mutarotase
MSEEYKKKYHQLYEGVAKLLVENRTKNYNPYKLLSEWDKLRTNIENQNKDE